MKTRIILLCSITLFLLPLMAVPLVAQDGSGAANGAEVPKASTELLKRVERVLKRYYDLRYERLVAKQAFDSDKAWEDAVEKGEFSDRQAFDEAVAKRRKADPAHFGKLYDELRKKLKAEHLKNLDNALGSGDDD